VRVRPIRAPVSSTLAHRTIERAHSGLRSGCGASLPELVRLIRTLSKNAHEVPVPQLVESIERDSSVLAKVIAVANKLGYNPSAVPIASLDQAIHLIGFDRVRTLAISLLLLEQTQQLQSTVEQRETAAKALCAGLMAQKLASTLGTVDSDQAFVCASLRNFGRIVLTSLMPEDWKKVTSLAVGRTEDEAEIHVFGLTSLELGRVLLTAADLPGVVLHCLEPFQPEQSTGAQLTLSTQMLGLSEFARRMSDLCFNNNVDAAGFDVQSRQMVASFRAFVPDAELILTETLKFTEERLSDFVRGLARAGSPVMVGHRLRQRIGKIDPVRPAKPTPVVALEPVLASSTPAALPSTATEEATTAWTQGIAMVRASLKDSSRTLAETFSVAMDVVVEGFGAEGAALFTAIRPGEVCRLSEQRGEFFRELQAARITAKDRSAFGICLSRRENVLIHDANDAKIRPYLPDWLQVPGAPASFVLLPLFHQQSVHGLILCAWREPRKIIMTPEHVGLIHTLLGLVAHACEQNRQAAA